MRPLYFLCFFFLGRICGFSAPQYYCTAANDLFFNHLTNLIGSIHRYNYEKVEEIAVYDLGLTKEQKELLQKIDKVKLYSLKNKNPALLTPFKIPTTALVFLGWYAWKPVVIQEALEKMPYLLWLDAGCTVKRPLDDLFAHIEKEGYFLSTTGDEKNEKGFLHPVGWGTTDFVKNTFGLDSFFSWILEKETLMAGFLGIAKKKQSLFLKEWVQFTKDMRHFADNGTAP